MPDRTTLAAVEACLERIERHEARLRAWVHLDAAGARAAAMHLGDEAAAGRPRGALHGIPVGIKDIFDVAGMLTASGAGAFAHRRPDRDAPAVALLREAGAVVLGKTVTTQFAFADPSQTRNPWNLDHTPGGSSSGSAAAVAAGMARVALGSQTIGSIIRPAAYCGIAGFKGTYGRISTHGVTPLAWSLDHVGIFARTVDDAALVFSVLARDPDAAPGLRDGGAAPQQRAPSAPRIGVLREWAASVASPEVRTHLEDAVSRFRRAGAMVDDVTLPPSAVHIEEQGRLILRVEAAAYHSQWFTEHAEEYAPKIRELVESGLGVNAVDYVRAHQVRYQFRRDMTAIFEHHDALLLPSAPSPAPPLSENTTGDPVFCAPWTFVGFPTAALPSGRARSGLPLSIQLVGPTASDARLLEHARWCEARLEFTGSPPL